jgi:hypothetical protein
MPFIPRPAGTLARSSAEVDRLFPWMRRDFIRVIPHFITPAWATDKSRFDPEGYAEQWKRMGIETVTLLTNHHDGYPLNPSKYLRFQPVRDFFGEQVAACRKRGIRVIAYYSLSLNSMVGSEHPEWRIRDTQDRVLVPDHRYFWHYHWLCVNSPFRDFVRDQFLEMAANYEVEGFWLDIVYLPPHPPETSLQPGQDTCFCAHCHRAYSEWYGGEHLIEALGTPRHDEFRAESYRRFLMDVKAPLLKLPRPHFITFNGAGKRRLPFYERVDEIADCWTGEAHSHDARCLFTKLMGRDGPPYELMSCSELVWSHNASKPTPLVLLESLATVIGGGTYTIGINHAPDGRMLEGNVKRLEGWSSWLRGQKEWLTGGEPIVEIGLLEAGQCCLPSRTAVWRWTEFLRNGHFLFTVPRDADPVRMPPAVIVPSGILLDEVACGQLLAWVEKGGRLLLDFPVALARGRPAFFQKLTGTTFEGVRPGYAFYLLPSDPALAEGIIEGEAIFYQCGEAMTLRLDGAKTRADLVPQFVDKLRPTDIQYAPNYPARREQAAWFPGVVAHRVGKGLVMTSAIPLACQDAERRRHPWPSIFAGNLARELLGGQMLRIRGADPVEVLAVRKGDRVALHLLNHLYDSGDFVPSREWLSLADLEIELGSAFPAGGKGALFMPGKEVAPVREEKGTLRLRLPKLGLYQGISLPSRG